MWHDKSDSLRTDVTVVRIQFVKNNGHYSCSVITVGPLQSLLACQDRVRVRVMHERIHTNRTDGCMKAREVVLLCPRTVTIFEFHLYKVMFTNRQWCRLSYKSWYRGEQPASEDTMKSGLSGDSSCDGPSSSDTDTQDEDGRNTDGDDRQQVGRAVVYKSPWNRS